MNILVLSELFYPHGGGAELATSLYAEMLAEAGFDVTVLTNKFSDERTVEKKGKLTIRRVPLFNRYVNKYSLFWRTDILLESFFRKLVKWSDYVYIPRLWFSAIPLARLFRKKIILHFHDYIPVCPISSSYDIHKKRTCATIGRGCQKCIYISESFQRKREFQVLSSVVLNSTIGYAIRYAADLSDSLICVSERQKEIILEGRPSLERKMRVIYNPVPHYEYTEITGDDFGYFGGPNWFKGFATLFNAMLLLNERSGLNLKVRATKFPEVERNFDSILRKSGFLVYGKLAEKEYSDLYSAIRSVIVPSIWHEPWPYVVVEALLKGRFVIASEMGGIPEQVKGCKGVLLFSADDQTALADRIEIVSNMEREEISELGFQNRAVFLKRRDTEFACKKFVALIDRLN